MTVKDLIDLLSQFDKSLDILCEGVIPYSLSLEKTEVSIGHEVGIEIEYVNIKTTRSTHV